MKYKGGPYASGVVDYDGKERLYKYFKDAGAPFVQYYYTDGNVYEMWVTQEEEELTRETLLELARAVLVLQS